MAVGEADPVAAVGVDGVAEVAASVGLAAVKAVAGELGAVGRRTSFPMGLRWMRWKEN